jgi:hypothetical protein
MQVLTVLGRVGVASETVVVHVSAFVFSPHFTGFLFFVFYITVCLTQS